MGRDDHHALRPDCDINHLFQICRVVVSRSESAPGNVPSVSVRPTYDAVVPGTHHAVETVFFCDALNVRIVHAVRRNPIFIIGERILFKEPQTHQNVPLALHNVPAFREEIGCVSCSFGILKFIVKPHDMYMGLGVKIVDLSGAVLKQAFDSLQSDYENGFVMEELVAQSNEIGRFHPQSVNTVRVPTVNYGDRIEIIHPFFRIGKGDSVVDNAGSGGIMVLVDVETGKTISKARDEHGHEYVKHPNTGYDLVGVQLPKWGEAIQLVKQLASVLPENKYTSWDLAYTDEHGWIMIEGNAKGQFVWQIVSRIGFKDEIEQIVAELNTERGSADAN